MRGRSIRGRVWFACILVGVLCCASAQVLAAPMNFSQQNVPDFSQHEVAGWSNYCAPTAGTNVAYYFAQTFAGLLQGHPVPPAPTGPGTLADIGASTNIAGNVPPGPPLPPPSNMANLMGTTAAGGTTLNGLRNGLDTYLETHDGLAGNAYWNTQILLANLGQPGGLGGGPFWNRLQTELSGGAGVVLAMHWQGNPGPNYDIPEPYNPYEYDAASAIGHAVTMVGYDLRGGIPGNPSLDVHDPANNPLVAVPVRSHVWPAVVADSYTVTVNPNDISIVVGAATGVIYGAVYTTPEPASWALLASGLLALGGLAALRRKRQGEP